jgi:hypothetical protein
VNVSNAVASATAGVRGALEHMTRDARQIANNPQTAPDANALVHLKVDRLQVGANIQVIKAVDDALGHLLDVVA